ncbi:MAG: hypothetical protein MUE95_11760 [Cyclobacteriaceae bacterium]|jgi:hypothetical protein|nr:hypothetical protein [Cyclobacteriaceae bacterium]
MKKILINLMLLFFLCPGGYAQDNLSELDKRNGFKSVKLGMPIDSVNGAVFIKEFKEKGHHPAKLFSITSPETSSISEIPVNKLEVKTYRDMIYEITVLTPLDTRLMKGLESAYGKPVYDVRDKTYTWLGQTLSLKFSQAPKDQLQLVYSSVPVRKMMMEDKNKKIDTIASDF